MQHTKTSLAFLLLLLHFGGYAQRYNFERFTIEDGLAQSQVTGIVQDQDRRLWIATLGGISCFNGREFKNYTKASGLNSNFTLSLAVDKHSNLWIGSARGLNKYGQQRFSSFSHTKEWVNRLISDRSGSVYAIRLKQLFKIGRHTYERMPVTEDPAEVITAIKTDPSGKLWASVSGKGLFVFENGHWRPELTRGKIKELFITDLMIDGSGNNKIWLLTTAGIYLVQNKNVSPAYPEIHGRYTAILQDHKGNVWIGSNRGAYYITRQQVIHFNAGNGFTDNIVNELYLDRENNIWLGTDGSGIFKFSNNNYVSYDETQGLNSSIVMAICNGPDPGTLWMGSYDGLYELKNNRIKSIRIPSENEESRRVNFLYNDRNGNIWMGTPGGGLWMHDGRQLLQMDKGYGMLAYNAILEDRSGKIWLSTNRGCYTFEIATRKLHKITEHFGSSLLETGRDSIVAGTQDGAWLIAGNTASMLANKEIKGVSILSMLKVKDYLLFGTGDYGIIAWNSKTGETRKINTKTGLLSDHIYSLLRDKHGVIWVGTGRGVNRLRSADFSIIANNSKNELVECNQNAILETKDHVWIGTTKGAMAFSINPQEATPARPYIYISSVSISPKMTDSQDTAKKFYREHQLGRTITLPHYQNHLNVNYSGIYLSNPGSVMYVYRLVGLDAKYSQPGPGTSINFTSIPPGKYTFEVRAVTTEGITSANTASFSFEVLPPYYQTTIFGLFAVIMLILLIIFTVYIILKLKERKRKIRLKIKLEEQIKIRKQTAEDFHDDLGNKLTRISVLSEVLGSMIAEQDSEKRNILKKINNNVEDLYTGTKDILWSLNPKNDTLDQLLNHIVEFGKEMFNNTNVQFSHSVVVSKEDTKLPLDLSRNLLMIFKEAIHNALKHAKATEVTFKALLLNNSMLQIILQDNGTGFNPPSAKDGHGINNMHVRAERIGADLDISSADSGTMLSVTISLSMLKYSKNV